MRLCPYCAETISDQDNICPHCREVIVAAAGPAAAPEPAVVLVRPRHPADAPQRAAPPPEIIKLKEAMRPYYTAGFEQVRLTRRRAEMRKRKPGLSPLDIVMMALTLFFCWPIALLILIENVNKKEKRVFFELEEDGNVDVYGDTLEEENQQKKKESSRTLGAVLVALLLILIVILFIWSRQPVQQQMFVLPNPQGPGWQGGQPPARASAFGLGAQFGQDGAEAVDRELENNR